MVIVITVYLPRYLGQETTKGPFGFRVKVTSALLSTAYDASFKQPLHLLKVKQKSYEYQFNRSVIEWKERPQL